MTHNQSSPGKYTKEWNRGAFWGLVAGFFFAAVFAIAMTVLSVMNHEPSVVPCVSGPIVIGKSLSEVQDYFARRGNRTSVREGTGSKGTVLRVYSHKLLLWREDPMEQVCCYLADPDGLTWYVYQPSDSLVQQPECYLLDTTQ